VGGGGDCSKYVCEPICDSGLGLGQLSGERLAALLTTAG
jgi:hypothetical protein